MFDKGTKVSAVKVDTSKNPEHETPSWEEHEHGSGNPQKSLPVDYAVQGRLVHSIVEDMPMIIDGHERNGEPIQGVMETSPVQNVEERGEKEVVIETMNSVYSVERIS